MTKVVLISNIPAPYRIPVYKLLSLSPGIELTVIFCAASNPDMPWDHEPITFEHIFLTPRSYRKSNREVVHSNLDVLTHLRRLRPHAVVTTGFNPTHLYAAGYCLVTGAKHICQTDGTVLTESRLTPVHKAARRLVYGFSRAFVGASRKSLDLFRSYGIRDEALFVSELCVDNARFTPSGQEHKRFDLIFTSRFVDSKNPLFAIDVAAALQRRLGREVSILFAGKGPLEASMRSRLTALGVPYTFHGYAAQAELPDLYRAARVMLFPTSQDPWGIVANEACAAGLPVVTTPHAGAAEELIRDGENGCICDLDLDLWVERTAELLQDRDLYAAYSRRGIDIASRYTFASAAEGIRLAIEHAAAKH